MCARLIVVCVLVLVLGLGTPMLASEIAVPIGCGELDAPHTCSGFPVGNTATCKCVGDVWGRTCQGRGWHSTVYAPSSFTATSPGKLIYSNPQPCGYRWLCATNDKGKEGEPCLVEPGCQFWHGFGIIESSFLHPNLFTDDEP